MNDSEELTCPRCMSAGVAVLPPSRFSVSVLQGIFNLPYLKNPCRCNACGYEWRQFVYPDTEYEDPPEPPDEDLE